MRYLLWTIQVLLAALFVFSGSMKLITPIAEMTKDVALPGPFLRFLGVAEILGGLGLVLPGMLRLHQHLTWLAAAGLTVIMAGATVITAATMGAALAALPLTVGILTAFVAFKRRAVSSRNASAAVLSMS